MMGQQQQAPQGALAGSSAIGRPTNVTIAAHGYSDVDCRARLRPTQHLCCWDQARIPAELKHINKRRKGRIKLFNTNVGYAFVNFIDPEDIIGFVSHSVNKEWHPGYHPRKIAQVSCATVQGIDCLIEKFRNSAIMAEFSDYRPKLWY
ncbi:hypothetical protein AC578_923 [Pseudocercospora eumusae]|uniref:Mei2-like C-terminal RNA recognition motif domain-containing protein n=1 Tax=Pseudocercospora eumusae TaxID=321146 RepID=A0A139HBU6_9PEZI|nr:hypothetical protein AC578_923 [Pseudocercospora eumusae]